MTDTKKQGTLRIYGAGGAGINSIKYTEIPNSAGFASVKYAAIDSSDANIVKELDADKEVDIHLLPTTKGVGGIRMDAYEYFSSNSDILDAILRKSSPCDYNIVVFAASAGTGSVVGPLLIDRLIKAGYPTVAITVISDASVNEARNSMNTILGLQQAATKGLKTPIITIPVIMEGEVGEPQANQKIAECIRMLALLFGGTHTRLDRTDVSNFLNYTKSTPAPPQIGILGILSRSNLNDEKNIPAEGSVISSISLLTDEAEPPMPGKPLYNKSGIMAPGIVEATKEDVESLYYCISTAGTKSLIEKVTENYSRFKSILDEIESATVIVPDNEKEGTTVTDEGLMF